MKRSQGLRPLERSCQIKKKYMIESSMGIFRMMKENALLMQ